jgi:hypothetical protein
MKSIMILVFVFFLAFTGIASAGSDTDRVVELEKKMKEINAALSALQDEISALKAQKAEAQKTDVSPSPASAAAPESAGEWAKRITLNGQVRFRGYDVDNIRDFDGNNDNDHWNVFRILGSLKATVKATDDVTAVIKVTNQNYGNGVATKYGQELTNISDKVFLDNAYINAQNLFGAPVDLTAGRQNLNYGTGFVFFRGKSQYSSTAGFFDGIKLSWRPTADTALDMLYMKAEENNRDNASEDDTNLKGVYFTASKIPVMGQAELYAMNRNDQIIDKNIWMFGSRISNKMENGLDYSMEAALQTGDALANVDQKAWGGKTEAGYTFKSVSAKPRIYCGLAYLSGDDTATKENEGWDVFYGGWGGAPQFGDLMGFIFVNAGADNSLSKIYNYNRLSSLSGEVVFGNFQMATIGASIVPVKDLTLDASYHNMKFNKTYAGVSNDFGNYYQTSLKYQYNKYLSFSLCGAFLAPGDAFNKTAKDTARELLWETNIQF